MRAQRGATDLAGVVLIDKPVGLTSHDVVAALRKATGEGRIGHAGTLDPMATGLLLVLIGRATRLEQYLVGHDKRYEARIVFGSATDTLDAEGKVIGQAPVPSDALEARRAADILAGFLGSADQTPPAYSAIKRDGVPAHRLARAGESPALRPRHIEVYEADLRAVDTPAHAWDVTFTVSKGTYVRSLARDIGLAAGTVAHLGALRRTRIGVADVDASAPLDRAIAAAESGDLPQLMIDPVSLLEMVAVEVDPEDVRDGQAVPAETAPVDDGERAALVTATSLLGVYRREGASLVSETLLVPGIAR